MVTLASPSATNSENARCQFRPLISGGPSPRHMSAESNAMITARTNTSWFLLIHLTDFLRVLRLPGASCLPPIKALQARVDPWLDHGPLPDNQ